MAKMTRKDARQRRHRRVRKTVNGTSAIPRMSVCRTGQHLYVQFIDDEAGHTLAAASTLDKALRDTADFKVNVDGAKLVGKLAADRAKAVSISRVVFDRGGFKFHGQIKAIAEAARAEGLQF